ncbi:ABC transporter ATP-binding protein [Pigmentiphaga aceris]|uniref:ABC transporter ATP-binding protein n=1 Tax=Pigmentiphaga aceris TaxID=1940612 RepID=A0A5C0B2T2_9BURK|nr:ABC transporter ATP-binding protein [Pigmentiphaga aceris]QEI07051.1 ABC transporter ATP-binding protein [Pigmentiphaga aceris]
MSTLIDIKGLNVAFPGHHAVRGLDLQLAAGETLALVGESGCGKSTTALAIMGLLPGSARVSGSIDVDGRNLLALPERELCQVRGKHISMIFQEPMTALDPVHTVGAQVAESLRQHDGLSAKAARARAIELLDLVRLPEPQRAIDEYPHRFSGGQRQRIMIAAAIACHPRLLVADEPTTALDVTIQAQILELLDTLRRELSMGLLLITHDLGVVAQWADRVAVMYAGKKLEEAPAARFFDAPTHAYSRGLLGASLDIGSGLHYRRDRLPEIRAITDASSGHTQFTLQGGSRANAPTSLLSPPTAPLLSLIDVHTHYRSNTRQVHAVQGVSLSLARGETLGLVGESGCGKSTLSRTIMRLVDTSSGKLVFDGEDITHAGTRQLRPYRRRVQMIFQDPYSSLNPRQTVGQILDNALVIHGVDSRRARMERVTRIIDAVGLPTRSVERHPHAFSGGQRQRIAIARALILQPELVICDEPVSALDVSIQAQILNLLADLKAEFSLSYLFISHDLAVVQYIADRVMVMQAGKIVETGDHTSIWTTPTHPYTRSLIDAIPHGSRAQRENARAA